MHNEHERVPAPSCGRGRCAVPMPPARTSRLGRPAKFRHVCGVSCIGRLTEVRYMCSMLSPARQPYGSRYHCLPSLSGTCAGVVRIFGQIWALKTKSVTNIEECKQHGASCAEVVRSLNHNIQSRALALMSDVAERAPQPAEFGDHLRWKMGCMAEVKTSPPLWGGASLTTS